MAFDHTRHTTDAVGFQIDKETGHRVGHESPPAKSPQDVEFPKWVEPHESHIVRKGEGDNVHVSTPAFPDFHIDRLTKKLTVLVHDAVDETRALAAHGQEPEKKEDE